MCSAKRVPMFDFIGSQVWVVFSVDLVFHNTKWSVVYQWKSYWARSRFIKIWCVDQTDFLIPFGPRWAAIILNIPKHFGDFGQMFQRPGSFNCSSKAQLICSCIKWLFLQNLRLRFVQDNLSLLKNNNLNVPNKSKYLFYPQIGLIMPNLSLTFSQWLHVVKKKNPISPDFCEVDSTKSFAFVLTSTL